MTWKGICFDLDNTLFDHEKAFKKAMEYCYHTYCVKLDNSVRKVAFREFFIVFKENCDKYWKMFEQKKISGKEYRRIRFNETMKSLCLPWGNETADNFHALYYKIVADFGIPYPGVDDLLSNLIHRDIQLAIITNGTVDTQYSKAVKIGAAKWIHKDNIIISEAVGAAKPKKEIFQYAENLFKLNADKLLFVGDTWLHDVAGPIEAGWQAVYLNTRGDKPETNHKPVAEFNNFCEMKRFLLEK